MSQQSSPDSGSSLAPVYQIRVKGHLGHEWTDWFAGLTVTLEDSGDTLLTGPVPDQAALYGLLRRVRDLGMPLLSVNCLCPNQTGKEQRTIMNTDRTIAIVVGILFIAATAAGIASVAMTSAIMNAPDFLVKMSENENQIILGALLEFVMGVACAGIAIWLYPVLRRQDEALALAAAGFRTIEGVIFCVAAGGLPALLALSREYVKAGAPDASYFQTLGLVVKAGSDWLFSGAGAIAFCLGALMYYVVLYRSKLIPRWLSAWGLIAIAMHLIAIARIMFGADAMATETFVLNVPILVNELVLAVWLIVKGFSPVAGRRPVERAGAPAFQA